MSETMMICTDRLEEIEDFISALDEWGCENAEVRVAAIRAFLFSTVGLTQYLERETPERIGNA